MDLNPIATAQLRSLMARLHHAHTSMPPEALDDILDTLRDLAVAADRAVRVMSLHHGATGKHGRRKRMLEDALASFSSHRLEKLDPTEPFSVYFHDLLEERRQTP